MNNVCSEPENYSVKCFCYQIIFKSSPSVNCPVESEGTTAAQEGFAKTLAAISPQLKCVEPSQFPAGEAELQLHCSRICCLVPGLQSALCLLTPNQSPAGLQEFKQSDLGAGNVSKPWSRPGMVEQGEQQEQLQVGWAGGRAPRPSAHRSTWGMTAW